MFVQNEKKKTPVLFAFLGVWINLIDKNSLCYIYFGATESDQSLPVFCSWHGNTYYDNAVMVNSNLVICIAIWFKNKKKSSSSQTEQIQRGLILSHQT